MRRTAAALLAASACLIALTAIPADAQGRSINSVDAALAKLGVQSTRGIDTDICFPANAVEYESLGKNAVLQLTSSSVLSTELPLKAVYVMSRGVRIPLQRAAISLPRQDGSRTVQVSYYLLPIHLIKSDGKLVADFSGARSGFDVSTFAAKEVPEEMPAFARLDEYDQPIDPDLAAVGRVIAREYPAFSSTD